jgi:hypothetical protein
VSWLNTSVHSGFARSPSEAMFPRLFPDAGWWCPSLNPAMGGSRLWDLSFRQNWGTLTNMANDDWVISGGKGALDFDGSNDHVNLGQRSPFQLDFSSRFSISAWIRTTATSGGIIGKRVVAGWYFSIESANIIGLVLQGTSSAVIVNSVASGVSDGNWHQVACTYTGNSNASGISLFVDGRQVSTTTVLNSAIGSMLNAIDTTIGAVTTNQFFLASQLDDIRLYNRALTASEVRQLWQIGRGNMPLRRRRRYTEQAGGNRRRRVLLGAEC